MLFDGFNVSLRVGAERRQDIAPASRDIRNNELGLRDNWRESNCELLFGSGTLNDRRSGPSKNTKVATAFQQTTNVICRVATLEPLDSLMNGYLIHFFW